MGLATPSRPMSVEETPAAATKNLLEMKEDQK